MINPMWLMLQQSSMLAKFFSPFFSQMPPYDLTPAPVFHWLVEYNAMLMSLFIYSAVIHVLTHCMAVSCLMDIEIYNTYNTFSY
jgi:hypothetical protein